MSIVEQAKQNQVNKEKAEALDAMLKERQLEEATQVGIQNGVQITLQELEAINDRIQQQLNSVDEGTTSRGLAQRDLKSTFKPPTTNKDYM